MNRLTKRRLLSGSTSTMDRDGQLNLVLLGSVRAERSESGNTILGRQAFASNQSSFSVTPQVSVQSGSVFGFPITVYDTPGLFEPQFNENQMVQRYQSTLQECESGPCVFLLVLRAHRFTGEDRRTVEKIERFLGQNRLNNTWILFTGGDHLVDANITIKEFIDRNNVLQTVRKYDHRYHVFNNRNRRSTDQARLLLAKVIQTSLHFKASEGGRQTRWITTVTSVSFSPDFTRRIVLLGKTGGGKSASGNTILGQREFESEMRMNSVTSKCSLKQTTVSGRSVSVVDTPGLFDTQISPEELMTEIARSVYLSSPGPHAFLIVFRVVDRFTEQEQQIPQQIEVMFGQGVLKYSIILFTHGDLLKGKTVEELIEDNSRLRDLVQKCGDRYHVFNNEAVNNRDQVNELLEKIDLMIGQNGGGHYTNEMFEEAQRFRREEEERRQREEERRQREEERRIQLENQREEEQRRYEVEMERVRIQMQNMRAGYEVEVQRLKAERLREEEKRKQQQKERHEEIEILRNTEESMRKKWEAQRFELERQREEERRWRGEEMRKQLERQRGEERRKHEMQNMRTGFEAEVQRLKAERLREEKERKQESEEFEQFKKQIEHKLILSGFAMGKRKFTCIGAIIGGGLGAIAGIVAGPAGAAFGGVTGATIGGAVGGAIHSVFNKECGANSHGHGHSQ